MHGLIVLAKLMIKLLLIKLLRKSKTKVVGLSHYINIRKGNKGKRMQIRRRKEKKEVSNKLHNNKNRVRTVKASQPNN